MIAIKKVMISERTKYEDAKYDNPSLSKPASLKQAEKVVKSAEQEGEQYFATLVDAYKSDLGKLQSFLKTKVTSLRMGYGKDLITAYQGLNCKRIKIVDALRKISNSLRETDETFAKSPLSTEINGIMLDALQTDIQQPPRMALIAVGTLEQWAIADYMDTYIEMIKKDEIHFELRNSLIRLLTSFARPEDKGILLDILKRSPETQPISYISTAAKALGDLGADDAIDRLVECLWLNDARGRDATAECRLALNKLNPDQVYNALEKVIKRQNKKVEDRAWKLNYAHTGLLEAKSAELLGDLGNKKAGTLLVDALNRKDPLPEPFKYRTCCAFQRHLFDFLIFA